MSTRQGSPRCVDFALTAIKVFPQNTGIFKLPTPGTDARRANEYLEKPRRRPGSSFVARTVLSPIRVLVGTALFLASNLAGSLVEYPFDSNAARFDPVVSATGISAGSFSSGAGVDRIPTGTSNLAWSGRSLILDNTGFYQATASGAASIDDYFFFDVTVARGSEIDFSEFRFYTLRRENVGDDPTNDEGIGAPQAFSLYSSEDGYETPIGSGFIPLADNHDGFAFHEINLSGVEWLQGVTGTTTFRLVFYAPDGLASPQQRLFRLDEVSVNGSVDVALSSRPPGGRPFFEEDFEPYGTGPLVGNSGWTAWKGNPSPRIVDAMGSTALGPAGPGASGLVAAQWTEPDGFCVGPEELVLAEFDLLWNGVEGNRLSVGIGNSEGVPATVDALHSGTLAGALQIRGEDYGTEQRAHEAGGSLFRRTAGETYRVRVVLDPGAENGSGRATLLVRNLSRGKNSFQRLYFEADAGPVESAALELATSPVDWSRIWIRHALDGAFVFLDNLTLSHGGGRISYETWVERHFAAGDRDDNAITGASVDPFGVGVPNLLAYALGEPPGGETSGLPTAIVPEGDRLVFSFRRVEGASDIWYQPEISSDLQTWVDRGIDWEIEEIDEGGEWETVRMALPKPEEEPSVFARLRIKGGASLPVLRGLQSEGNELSVIPGANDVTMRALRFSEEAPEGSKLDVFEALTAFHATRLEWVNNIPEDQEWRVGAVRDSGRIFGAGISGALLAEEKNRGMATLDLDGNPVIMPHKREWANPQWQGDVSNPGFLAEQLAAYRSFVDLGVDTIQRDEVTSSIILVRNNGAGFSDTGVAGFGQWLEENVPPTELDALGVGNPLSFDYRAYLKDRGAPSGDDFASYDDPLKEFWIEYWADETARFFEELIAATRDYADRPIGFSCNNTSVQLWSPVHEKFDFAISELLLETAYPEHIWSRADRARDLGRFQVFGSPKTREAEVDGEEKITLTRRVLATAYAAGMAARVPWDIFQQTEDGSGRFYGCPRDFGDLFGFVRAFDWSGYVEDSVFGGELTESGFATLGGTGSVYGTVRRRPDDSTAPTLVHLVDWGSPLVEPNGQTSVLSVPGDRVEWRADGDLNLSRSGPEAFTLLLPKSVMSAPSSVSLRVPAPYGADAHRRAVQLGDFENLVLTIPVSVRSEDSDHWAVDLPALTPWGILEWKE